MKPYNNFVEQDQPNYRPAPLANSETAEKFLHYGGLAIAIIFASILSAIGVSWYTEDLEYIKIIPGGLILAALVTLLVIANDVCAVLGFHPIRGFIDRLDGKKDGRIFGVPIADEFTDESATEAEQERRVRRAIKAVVENSTSATRDSICGKHKLMSQREWYFWHIRMIRSGIIDDAHRVLVPSIVSATEQWDTLIQSKRTRGSAKYVNVGEGKKSATVLFSDLLNKAYVNEESK